MTAMASLAPENGADPGPKMEWLAPDHLLVRYSAGSRIFEQDAEVSGVTVSYRPDAG